MVAVVIIDEIGYNRGNPAAGRRAGTLL